MTKYKQKNGPLWPILVCLKFFVTLF